MTTAPCSSFRCSRGRPVSRLWTPSPPGSTTGPTCWWTSAYPNGTDQHGRAHRRAAGPPAGATAGPTRPGHLDRGALRADLPAPADLPARPLDLGHRADRRTVGRPGVVPGTCHHRPAALSDLVPGGRSQRRDGAAPAGPGGQPLVSFNSWALWIVIWLPLVVRLRDRSRLAYLRTLRAIAHVGLALAVLSVAFIASQLLGVRYYDWLGEVVPSNLLVDDFVISYPIDLRLGDLEVQRLARSRAVLHVLHARCLPGQCAGHPDERGQGAGAAGRPAVHRRRFGHRGRRGLPRLPAPRRAYRQPASLCAAGVLRSSVDSPPPSSGSRSANGCWSSASPGPRPRCG